MNILNVAIFEGAGAPRIGATLLVTAAESQGINAAIVSADDVRGGALANFRIVVFPGGSGGQQAAALQPRGSEQLKYFIKGGGSYLGICGGAFLATTQYTWSLGILDAGVMTSPDTTGDPRSGLWYRGNPASILVELTLKGCDVLGG